LGVLGHPLGKQVAARRNDEKAAPLKCEAAFFVLSATVSPSSDLPR
jgi:hypothetical protein